MNSFVKLLACLVVFAMAGTTRAQHLEASDVPQFGISWSSVDGGMSASSDGVYTLTGTITPPGATLSIDSSPFSSASESWGAAALPMCPGDFDEDGFVTGLDFDVYITAFETGDIWADFDGDGFVTGLDFDEYVAAFEAGC